MTLAFSDVLMNEQLSKLIENLNLCVFVDTSSLVFYFDAIRNVFFFFFNLNARVRKRFPERVSRTFANGVCLNMAAANASVNADFHLYLIFVWS